MDDITPRMSSEKLLPRSDTDDGSCEVPEWPLKNTSWVALRVMVTGGLLVTASLLLNITLLAMLHRARSNSHKVETSLAKPMLYSPANDVLETILVKFDSSIYNGVTPYQGPPNPTNNALWLDLYDQERTHLTPSQAALLPNKTLPEAASPGKYVVLLNVFHNLHCLDSLRQVLYYFLDNQWTATSNPYLLMGNGTIDDLLIANGGMDNGVVHLDHCIDALRQQEMCLPDVTPNVFQYSRADKGVRAFSTVVHECRNFTKIKQWARENRSPAWEGWKEGGVAMGKCGDEDEGDGCLWQ